MHRLTSSATCFLLSLPSDFAVISSTSCFCFSSDTFALLCASLFSKLNKIERVKSQYFASVFDTAKVTLIIWKITKYTSQGGTRKPTLFAASV